MPRSCVSEIFGRQHNTRAGWTTLGNQLDGVRIYEKDVLDRVGIVRADGNVGMQL